MIITILKTNTQYILATTPERAGTKLHSSALLLQPLIRIHQTLITQQTENEQLAQDKTIIFDGDLIRELYGINEQTALNAIVLVMGKSVVPGNMRFKAVIVQIKNAPHGKYTHDNPSAATLKRTIRVLINNSKEILITTTLDRRGRSPNLMEEIRKKANLTTTPK